MGGHCRSPKESRPFSSYRESTQGSWIGLRPSQPELEDHIGFTLDPRVWIPCVSFLPPLSLQGGVQIGGAKGTKRDTSPQGLLR